MRSVFTLPRARSSALVVAAAVLLAACSGDSGDEAEPRGEQQVNVVQGAAPGEPSRRISLEEAQRIESPPHTAADVDFMQGMIHHHAQALVMTSMVRDRAAGRSLAILARRIEIAQEAEIETMERWLTARDEDNRTPRTTGTTTAAGA